MKIVHLIFSLETGGSEAMLVDIINEQVLYADISLYIINNKINKNLLAKVDQRANVKCFNRRSKSINPLPLLLLNISLMLKKPKVIHCHNHNAIATLFKIFYKRAILTIHDTRINSIHLKKYHNCYSISNAVKIDLFNRYAIDTKIINNGINFKNIRSRKKIFQNSIFRILQVSRFDHLKKGQHIAIDAIRLLKDNDGLSNIQLDFVGDGDSSSYLKNLCIEKGVNDIVNFLGTKERLFIYDNLKNYNLLIQPSIYEGFGLTIVEAMAARIPVLVSAIEGPMEVVQGGLYGYYFKTESAEDLAIKIKEIIETDINRINNLTDNAYSYSKEKYSITNTARNYLLEYKNI